MAGDELRERYGKWICFQLYCPPWDCRKVIIADQVKGELAFVQKPNKCVVYCCTVCLDGILCLPCCGTISVHSLDENGHAKISSHSTFGSAEEQYDDIAGVVVGLAYPHHYVNLNGAPVYDLKTSGAPLKEIMDAVNNFLRDKRQRAGLTLEEIGRKQCSPYQLGTSPLPAAPAQQQHKNPNKPSAPTQQQHENSKKPSAPAQDFGMTPYAHQGNACPPRGLHQQQEMPPHGVMISHQRQHNQAGFMQTQMQSPPPPQDSMFGDRYQYNPVLGQQQQYTNPPPETQLGYGGYPPPQQLEYGGYTYQQQPSSTVSNGRQVLPYEPFM